MLEPTGLEALGLNVEEGLANCTGDPEFYEEMLAEYVRGSEAGLEQLQRDFDCQDWADYRIRVHSLKNTSRIIGATALSGQAYRLETAAKETDTAVLLAEHAPFLADCRALISGIRRIVG